MAVPSLRKFEQVFRHRTQKNITVSQNNVCETHGEHGSKIITCRLAAVAYDMDPDAFCRTWFPENRLKLVNILHAVGGFDKHRNRGPILWHILIHELIRSG